ncbi:MAG: hypothetical protein IT385_06285 [Deltaproteobacteria bacterium]|nr:hypothetical protein [Deltaproteobacteria bacterium]
MSALLRSAVLPFLVAAVGLVVGVLADPLAPRAPLFAAATLAALGTRPAHLFAALTLAAGIGTLPTPLPSGTLAGVIGGLGAGLALGLLGRAIASSRLVESLGRTTVIALAALGLALTLMLPDGPVRLAGPDGPLHFDALLVDPATASRVLLPIPAIIERAAPLSDLEPLVLLLAALTAVAALAMTALRAPVDVILRAVARGTAAVAILVSFMALAELAMGSVTLDAAALRQDLSLLGRAPVIDLATPPEAALALWSRPMVDGLRLIAALLLFAATLTPRPAPVVPRDLPALSWLALALAIAALSLLVVAPPLALAGGLAVGLGALLVGRLDPRGDQVVRLALLLMLALWVWGAIAAPPIAG